MYKEFIDEIYIKSQILRQYLINHNDDLSLSIKAVLQLENVHDVDAILSIEHKLQTIIQNANVNFKRIYNSDIY